MTRLGERGQALAEMALIAPLLLVLLAGCIEIGRFAYFSVLVANAARAGVQYGAFNVITALDNTGMRNAAKADGQNVTGLDASASHSCRCADGSASTCLTTDCPSSHRIVYVQVTATGDFDALLHFPGLPQRFPVSAQSTMRVAQ